MFLNIAKHGEKTVTFQFTGTGNKFNLIMRMAVSMSEWRRPWYIRGMIRLYQDWPRSFDCEVIGLADIFSDRQRIVT